MTPLRQQMIDAMQLRSFAARTQESYIGAVRQIAKFYHRSPELITRKRGQVSRKRGQVSRKRGQVSRKRGHAKGGVFQDSCRVTYQAAALLSSRCSLRSGFNRTTGSSSQFLVLPLQRSGCLDLAS